MIRGRYDDLFIANLAVFIIGLVAIAIIGIVLYHDIKETGKVRRNIMENIKKFYEKELAKRGFPEE